MKKLLIFILMLLVVSESFGKTIRKTSNLKNNAWNYAILLDGEMINSKSDLDKQINILFDVSYFDEVDKVMKGSASMICTINLTNRRSQMALLSLPGVSDVFEVWINGKKLKNLQEDDNFVADISSFLNQKQVILVLKFKKDYKSLYDLKSSDLISMVDNFKIHYLSGVFVQRFEVKKDTYFKSYLIEAHLNNFSGKDVDGKLYARFIDKNTYQILFENNNCAFTRSGDEIIIDVIFPEMGNSLKPGQYVAEVELVDKENNEETVDILTSLVRIKE